MKSILIPLLLFLGLTAIYTQQRVETIQWYTDTGGIDAFETKVFDTNGNKTFSCAQINNSVVISSIITYVGNKEYIFDINGVQTELIETNKNEIISTYYTNGIPDFQVVDKTINKNHSRQIRYNLPDFEIREMTETIITPEGETITNYLDPETLDILSTKIRSDNNNDYRISYKYDSKDRIVLEIQKKNGIIVKYREIKYIE